MAASVKTSFTSVDEYISLQPVKIQKILQQLRKTIRQAAPGAEELISYNIPAYRLNGMLIFFAAWKNHIGIYPISSAMKQALKDLESFTGENNTAKFQLDKPIPLKLVARITKMRIEENKQRIKQKIKNSSG